MPNDFIDNDISTLIGKGPIRVYNTGDPLTEDYIENRVNIETSETGEIVNIWLG